MALSRFRSSNHNLSVERLRYVKCDRDKRWCEYCKKHGVEILEDEIHFLLVCPLYAALRQRYLSVYIRPYLDVFDTFTFILNSKNENCVRDLAAYTYHAFKIHSENIVY